MPTASLRLLLVALLAVTLTGGLAACGKKARPETPADATYPRQYPDPQSVD
ncbi:hypothetical protein [Roseospirillum parvum]|uniref:Lipoprotein-attachment site-containing protein n=1 Tax=Roseospirillum parvum TaxID=83401 RepID=A0A1G7ZSG3_9PROT|nr:hypothetical protein [Roseospirillum parvum]SDH11623.1 hypothetical protein SAMN05421742_104204 [Roseospirillum parvum]